MSQTKKSRLSGLLVALSAIVVAAAIALSTQKQDHKHPFMKRAVGHIEKTPESDTPTEKTETSPEAASSEAPIERLDPPSVESVQGEISKSPETPPAALMAFARRIATRMERVLQLGYSTEATPLFDELEQCVISSEDRGLPQAQALCLVNAARLAEAFPEGLSERSRILTEKAPENVKKLVHAMSRMGDAEP